MIRRQLTPRIIKQGWQLYRVIIKATHGTNTSDSFISEPLRKQLTREKRVWGSTPSKKSYPKSPALVSTSVICLITGFSFLHVTMNSNSIHITMCSGNVTFGLVPIQIVLTMPSGGEGTCTWVVLANQPRCSVLRPGAHAKQVFCCSFCFVCWRTEGKRGHHWKAEELVSLKEVPIWALASYHVLAQPNTHHRCDRAMSRAPVGKPRDCGLTKTLVFFWWLLDFRQHFCWNPLIFLKHSAIDQGLFLHFQTRSTTGVLALIGEQTLVRTDSLWVIWVVLIYWEPEEPWSD